MRARRGVVAAGLWVLLGAFPVSAQDTIQVADSTRAADSTAVLPALDSLAADTLVGDVPDSLRVYRMEPLPGVRPTGDPALVAAWDLDDLLRTRANTLLELLSTEPGAIPLRTGDYGSPEGMVFLQRAGGRLRVFIDGSEEPALDGSVPDLAQISLGGLASVRVDRAGGETRIHLRTLQPEAPSPLSVIEAGTGDLETNIFRGTFLHPNAFGGGLSLVFERVDSEGVGENGAGSLQNVWFRYVRPLGDRFTLSGDIRSRRVQSELDRAAPTASRSTRSLRLRGRLADGVGLELYATENRLDLSSDTVTLPLLPGDDVAGTRALGVPRSSHYGARLGLERGPLWGQASVRHMDPAGRPTIQRGDVDGGIAGRAGGVSGRFGLDRRSGETRSVVGISAWTGSLLGVSLYGSWDRGERFWQLPAAPGLGIVPDSLAALYPEGSDARYLTAGARVDWGPLQLDGAWLRAELDSVLPLGNRVDLGIRAFPGDDATGFQVSGSLGLPVGGFRLEGSLQEWDEEGIYRPRRIYRGGISFHDTFYPTENLEITASLLAEGRDPMLVPVPDPATGTGPVRVPFYQSWNAHLQIRVVTVRIFVRWDNLFIRPNNQDIPGLALPRTRAMYGVRWTLRN